MTDRKKFVIIYGLYLSWLLSFLYKGPLVEIVFSGSYFKDDVLLLLTHMTPLVLIFLVRSRWVTKENDSKVLCISILASLLISMVMLFAGKHIDSMGHWGIILTLGVMLGIAELTFIMSSTGWFIRWLNIKDMFMAMAVIVLIANTVVSVVNLLIYLSYDMLAIAVWLSSCLVAFLLAFGMRRVEAPISRPKFVIPIKKESVLLMMSVFYLFSIGGGVVFDVITPAMTQVAEFTSVISLIPYIIGAGVVYLLLRKSSPSVDYFLMVSIACIIIGLIIFQYIHIDSLVLLANTFTQVGYGVMDVFMWGLVGMIAYVYDKPYTVVYYTMSANVLGVITGALISEVLSNQQPTTVSLVSLICAVIGMLIVPFIYKKTVADIEMGAKTLELEQIKLDHIAIQLDYELLTEREREVIALLLTDLTNKRISEQLFISENTLKKHAKSIYKKLDVKNKRALREVFRDADQI